MGNLGSFILRRQIMLFSMISVGSQPRMVLGLKLPGSRSIQATRSKHNVWPGSFPGLNGQSALRLCRDRKASSPFDPNTMFGGRAGKNLK